MAKSSKRSRKFAAKGGVQKMLDRGQTFTKKGRVRNGRSKRDTEEAEERRERRATERRAADREEEQRRAEEERKRADGDFFGGGGDAEEKENGANGKGGGALGGMDMEGFFQSVVDGDEGDGSRSDDEEAHVDSDNEAMAEDFDSGSDDDDESDDASDDDDGDVDAAERRMKREMAKMSRKDPEFHKYLQDNEGSLLRYGEGAEADEDNDGGSDDDMNDDDEEEEEGGSADATTKNSKNDAASDDDDDDDGTPRDKRPVLTPSLLHAMERSAFRAKSSGGCRGLKKIVSAYRSACHLSEEASGDGDVSLIKKGFRIDDSAVFDRLMVSALDGCHVEFRRHLLGAEGGDDEEEAATIDENKPVNPKLLQRSSRWDDLRQSLQSFLRSTLHLLSEAKEPALLSFVLKSLSHYVPLLTPFPKLAKSYLQSLLKLWSAPLDTSEDYQAVRLKSFLRIRQLAVTQPFPFVEDCLKSSYLSYARRAKFGTAASVHSALPTLTFMGNCVVELYSLDYASSYSHAFVYVRQLALHLRNALQKRTSESLRAVYCWQYVHCLRLWAAVLSAACGSSRGGGGGGAVEAGSTGTGGDDESKLMRSLVYPLTEVVFGTARLVPTARHLPLRLHCVRMLQQVASASETFIPTTSVLLDALDLKELRLKSKKVKAGKSDAVSLAIRLPVTLKLPKETALRTVEQTDACLSELFVLLGREVDLYRYSPAFPEFAVRVVQRLRQFAKETKNGKYRAYARGCIDSCERYSAQAVAARAELMEAPKDVRRLEALKPSGTPSMGERHDVALAKERRLEEAARPKTKKAAGEQQGGKKKKGATKRGGKEEDAEEEEEEDATEQGKKRTRKGKKKKKKAAEVNENDLKNEGALKQKDQVHEGIDWSDDDDRSGDGMDASD